MKQVFRAASAIVLTTGIVACSDNDPDFYRSSGGIATDDLHVYVEAMVHTHFGAEEEPDETHTTLLVEFSGFDNDGYFYVVELSEGDVISAGIDSLLTELTADYFPDEGEPLSVIYYNDFDTITEGTTFDVVFDRDRDTALHSSTVTLPLESEFTITPAEDTVDLAEPLVVSWTEVEDDTYSLKFLFTCEIDGEITYQSHVRFPNSSVETIASPYTFNPSNFFNPETPEDFDTCELRSTLKTYSKEEVEESPFADLIIRSTREQNIIKSLVQSP